MALQTIVSSLLRGACQNWSNKDFLLPVGRRPSNCLCCNLTDLQGAKSSTSKCTGFLFAKSSSLNCNRILIILVRNSLLHTEFETVKNLCIDVPLHKSFIYQYTRALLSLEQKGFLGICSQRNKSMLERQWIQCIPWQPCYIFAKTHTTILHTMHSTNEALQFKYKSSVQPDGCSGWGSIC